MEFDIFAAVVAATMILVIVWLIAYDAGRLNARKACNDNLDFSRRSGTKVRVVDAGGNVHKLYLVSEHELATLRGQARAHGYTDQGEEHY